MVEKFEIEIGKRKQLDKYVKAKQILAIAVLFVYAIVAFTTSIVLKTKAEKPGVAYGSQGITNKQYVAEVTFFNQKTDGSIKQINLADFTLQYGGFKTYKAVGIKTAQMNTVYSGESYNLVCDKEEITIKIYFEQGSGTYGLTYSFYEVFYKGTELESMPSKEAQKVERTAIILFETIAILLMWWMGVAIINNKNNGDAKSHYYKSINKKVLEELEKKGFVASKKYFLSGYKTGINDDEKLMICFDNKSKKSCLIDYNKKKAYIVGFGDIVSYSVMENNGVKVVEEISLFSAIPTQTTKNVCKKLSLVVVMDDLDDTNVVYELIKSGVTFESQKYKTATADLINVTSFLEIITSKKHTEKEQKFVFCEYCGAKNKAESLRCESCGSPLKE